MLGGWREKQPPTHNDAFPLTWPHNHIWNTADFSISQGKDLM